MNKYISKRKRKKGEKGKRRKKWKVDNKKLGNSLILIVNVLSFGERAVWRS